MQSNPTTSQNLAGRLTTAFAKFCEVVGVDCSSQALDSVERPSPFSLVQADSEQLPFGKDAFQLVLMLDILEHIDDHQRILREAYATVRDNGYLLISVPAYRFLWGVQDILSHHKRRYTGGEVRELVQESGFSIRRLTYFNTLLFPIIASVRLLRRGQIKGGNGVGSGQSDFAMTKPGFLNELLLKIFSSEKWWLRWVDFPFGTSILCLAQKASPLSASET